MTGALQPLPTIAGPLRPIGPELERELALLFERHEDGELAEAIVAWAFERGLAVRSPLGTDLAHLIVRRDGAARMVRVVTSAPRRPPPKPRGDEWTASMPARRRP